MSRTDKTRPFWVKREEYKICRPRLTEEAKPWTYQLYEYWRGEFRCGCKMCGWDAYGTPQRKTRRAWEKKYCSDGWREEWDDEV